MNRKIANVLLGAVLTLCIAAPATIAGQKKAGTMKADASAHKAAVKKCNDDYKEAVKAGKAKKGKEQKDAMAAAKKARTQCLAGAPK